MCVSAFCIGVLSALCVLHPSTSRLFLSSRQVLRPYALVQHLIRSDGGSTHHGGTGRRLSERGGGDQSEGLQCGVWACRLSCARCAVLFNEFVLTNILLPHTPATVVTQRMRTRRGPRRRSEQRWCAPRGHDALMCRRWGALRGHGALVCWFLVAERRVAENRLRRR